jgi:ribonuclease D
VTVVVHAGDNDLVQLKRRDGFRFAGVFDTSIAARFLGLTSLGLEVLLEKYLSVTLPPSRQKDDWSVRPLTPAQIDYAAADVLHLSALAGRLREDLALAGRLGWVEEECAALAAEVVEPRAPDPDAWLRPKGARDLPPRGLAILRELWGLREALALAADRPPFKILGDDTLMRLAQQAPADRAALAALPGMTPRVIERRGERVLAAIARALALPEADLPRLERPHRPRVPGIVQRRAEALRRWRAEVTTRVGLPPGVFLSNRLITAIAHAGPRDLEALALVPGVLRWRAEAFGREVLAAIARA